MKKLLLSFLLAISTTVSLPILAKATDPGAGRTFLLIGQIYQEEYQNFINQVGLTPSGASIYGTFYTGSFEQGTGMSYVDFIENNRPGSRILAAVSFKDNPGAGGYANVNDGLRGIINGQEDGDINSFINIFKSHPKTTFMLRVDYEVNSLYIGMDPNLYKNAYRRVVDRIRQAGVNNVEYVYHPVRNFSDVQAFYPGANYVDWFALSIFNNDVCLGNVSTPNWCRSLSVEPDVVASFNWAKSQGLPLLIAESAAQAPGNSSPDGFNDYLSRLNNLVKQFDIKGLVYINSDWRNFASDPNFTDSRVQKFSAVQSYWQSTFGNGSRYVYLGQTQPPVVVPPVVVPPSVGAVVKVEAESGVILGGASKYNDGSASNGQGVAYISSPGAGFSLTNVPQSSIFSVTYASALSGNISVRINTQDVGNLIFSSTGNWVGAYNKVSINNNIPANATVDVFYDSGDAAMNVDFVEFTTTSAPTTSSSAAVSSTRVSVASSFRASVVSSVRASVASSISPISKAASSTGNSTASGGVFGMQTNGTVYHLDGRQSASFVYLCVNGDCRTATKTNGRYERPFSPVDSTTSYNIEFKIQDNATGQCITSTNLKPGNSLSATPCYKAP